MLRPVVRGSLAISLILSTACNAAPTGDPTDAGTNTGANGLPCDVDRVLETRCRSCHGPTPLFGAPMSLVNWADLHAPAKTDPSKPVLEMVALRIADSARPMPPTGDLSSADRAALEGWIAAGGPEDTTCGNVNPRPDAGQIELPCEPTHRITAHASNDPSRGFPVPSTAGNLYQCFTFRSPFDGRTEGTAWAPITDDARVLHHWILYRTATPQADQGVMPCQMPRDAVFVAGWAPGGTAFVMPEDTGLELPGPNDWMILQVHYHNAAGLTDANDASGVALCTTPTPRPRKAGIVTLGTVGINIPAGATGYETTHLCGQNATARLPAPLRVLSSFPHMHQLGRALHTEILRGGNDGPAETLVDVQHFSFDDQKHYPHDPPKTVNPGDAVRTTCVYDNPNNFPVHAGERTEDEMCFNFVLVEPIDIVGPRQCIGLF
jgi:hypothetical protein